MFRCGCGWQQWCDCFICRWGDTFRTNDVDAIDDLNGNYSDDGDKALANDAKSVAVGKNNEIYGATYEEDNGKSMSSVRGGSTIDPIVVSKIIYVNATVNSNGNRSEAFPFQTLKKSIEWHRWWQYNHVCIRRINWGK